MCSELLASFGCKGSGRSGSAGVGTRLVPGSALAGGFGSPKR